MKEYLTDQELEQLIEQMEKQKLYAPRHMKEQILSQAFPKQTGGAQPQSGGEERAVRFFPHHHDSADDSDRMGRRDRFYSLKIIAGMAAALFLLAVLPIQGDGRYDDNMRRPGDRQGAWIQAEAELEYFPAGIFSGAGDGQQAGDEHRYERGAEYEDRDGTMDINRVINERTWAVNRRINSWFDRMRGIYQEIY